MNIIHMKYAVEVAKVGSINKASENLSMAQPNISRAIKDLEADLGITIFDRSAKGMNLTAEGREFIAQSQKILNQLNDLETMFKSGEAEVQKFSISAPRAGYIAEAFADFSKLIDSNSAEIVLDETSTFNTIKKVVSSECKIGIIRYEEAADRHFKEMLDKHELAHKTIADFKHLVIMSKESRLNDLEEISESDLQGYIQITHSDPYEASITASNDRKNERRESANRCIFVFDTAAQLELLSENKDTFMWVSPVPQKLLDRYGLVQKDCTDNNKVYKDVLIYRRDYKLTKLDAFFIEELQKSKEKNL